VLAPDRTDVLIAGAGPAGLAAAIALRARGASVVVADPCRPGQDKCCGEGLMPDSLATLVDLGIRLDQSHAFPFQGIRFVGGGHTIDACFPSGHGFGIRRTDLHQILVDRAVESGATMLWGTPVQGLTTRGVQLNGHKMMAEFVVGADGASSRVRSWAGLERSLCFSARFGFRRHYAIEPWSQFVEIHWASHCQIYVTPIAEREVCVVVMSRNKHLRLTDALPLFPTLNERLRHVTASTLERGAVTVTRRLARVRRGNVVLLGDASGSVDAITGEGLRLSFGQGLALAQAIAAGDLRFYSAEHRRLSRRPALMAGLMLTLDRFNWLRGRVLGAFAHDPALFAAHLAWHLGDERQRDFLTSLVPLCWRIAAAGVL
jgi:flavin-dependent dehydrogenase